MAIPASLFADTGLDAVVAASKGTLEWEPDLEIGVISNGINQVVFKTGMSWALLNYEEKVPTGEIRRGANGAILFSDEAAKAVEAALLRPRDIVAAAPSANAIVQGSAQTAAGTPASKIAAIIIDPGHGGRDPGTNHSHVIDGKTVELVEKDITLKVASQVYDQLKAKYPDKQVVLTRKDDSYVTLEQRTEIANNVKLAPDEAMIFISIHANASFDPTARGYEVWYLPPAYRRNVIDPTSLGNSTKELYPILNSMREEEYTIESVLLGKKILGGVQDEVKQTMINRGLKEESWFVVRNAKMPAVLIELGFVTNKDEASLLLDPEHLKKMATGIYNGISDFVTYFDKTGGFTE